MGEWVTSADEIHLAVIMTGQHVELASKKKLMMIGQHVELACKKKREKIGQHVELADKKNAYEK